MDRSRVAIFVDYKKEILNLLWGAADVLPESIILGRTDGKLEAAVTYDYNCCGTVFHIFDKRQAVTPPAGAFDIDISKDGKIRFCYSDRNYLFLPY